MQGAAPASGVLADVFSSKRVLATMTAAALAVTAFATSAQQPAPALTTPGSVAIPGQIIKKKIPQCQGLKIAECNANPDCMFVPQGVRKDGQPIPAYCRAKPPPPPQPR